jgi:hypothetical protein
MPPTRVAFDRLASAHRSAEAAHTRAWRAHAEAAILFDHCGKSEAAARERRLAENNRRGAEIERERLSALLSGDEIAYERARTLRVD